MNAGVMALLWRTRPKCNKVNVKVVTSTNMNDNPSINQEVDGDTNQSLKESFKQVFMNKTFVLFAFGNGLHMALMYNALIYIVDTMVDKNYNLSFGSLAPFLFTLFGLVGRLLCGILKQVPHLSSMDAGLVSSVIGVTGCLMIGLSTSALVRLIAWSLNGISFGVAVASLTVTTAKLLGRKDLAKGMGILMIVSGVGTTVGGPLNGNNDMHIQVCV